MRITNENSTVFSGYSAKTSSKWRKIIKALESKPANNTEKN